MVEIQNYFPSKIFSFGSRSSFFIYYIQLTAQQEKIENIESFKHCVTENFKFASGQYLYQVKSWR